MNIGTTYLGNRRARFTVWAPFAQEVTLHLVAPAERMLPLRRNKFGYWRTVARDIAPDTSYFYRLDQTRERPDPASHFQPQGVHGPSQVIDHQAFAWGDQNWRGREWAQWIIYELHVGTCTPEGTFAAIIPRLDDLKEIGINAIELMPVAQFPGERNWGYDGVHPFAVQQSYGGPQALKSFVNACHQKEIAVILDVVYNHLGPEGNYLWDYGPYFTDRYQTPWGNAVNFDGPHSEAVRNFFIQNALHWLGNYHIDALRLDAIHAIHDMGAKPFLRELAEKAAWFAGRTGREFHLIAESNLNDVKIIKPAELGGYGMAAQWCDDFHHALRTLLTGEQRGYYADFGKVGHLVKALREGFVYAGQYSRYHQRRQGNSSQDRPAQQFVVFAQNHDQVGNRLGGERLSQLVPFEALKLAAGVVLLSPYIPLLFMGEEYGETAPFLYFVSHGDADLIAAVRAGRLEEFKAFNWQGEPPDPQSVETFRRSKLQWHQRREGRHGVLLNFYQALIRLRQTNPVLARLDKDSLEVDGRETDQLVVMRRWHGTSAVLQLYNFNRADVTLAAPGAGRWEVIFDSSEKKWHGPGSLLPPSLHANQEITLRGHGLVICSQE